MLAIPTARFYRLLITALVTLISWPALADTITGQASVIDGDTLEVHGQRIRLSGIDAPESSQLCRGDDSLQYRCGAKVANELDEYIDGRTVSCEGVGKDQYGRVVAICSIDDEDIGLWLVRNGLAFDWPRYSKGKYVGAQKEAEREGGGYGRGVTWCLGPIGLAFVTAGGLAGVRMMRTPSTIRPYLRSPLSEIDALFKTQQPPVQFDRRENTRRRLVACARVCASDGCHSVLGEVRRPMAER